MGEIAKQYLSAFEQESNSWKKLLECLRAENCYFKARIADIVSGDISNEMLAIAEAFQNRFLRKDELMAFARSDIREFDKFLASHAAVNGVAIIEVLLRQKKLHDEIAMLESGFNKLKFEFYKYMAGAAM